MYLIFNNSQARFFITLLILTFLSACGGSKTKTPDTIAPVITLNGDSRITLYINDTYNELGASASDNKDVSVSVVISGTVDTSILGNYTITYSASDNASNNTSITRTITVVMQPDTTPPVIVIFGDNNMIMLLNDIYTELGASAKDERDGIVEVTIEGSVDSSTLGHYTVNYSATDEAGNNISTTREIDVVLPPDTISPIITLNGDSNITLPVNDTYIELGASAVDERDGSIEVIIEGSVDTSVEGSYAITYRATDKTGNEASVIRAVEIITATPPVADAGISQFVTSEEDVNLSASDSTDTEDKPLSYRWLQTDSSGVAITLNDNNVMQPTFKAPLLTTAKTFLFEVQVTNHHGLADTDSVSIAIAPVIKQKINDTGIVQCSTIGYPYVPQHNNNCTETAGPQGAPIPAGQDADYGRDRTANDNTDGHAGFSFTKLDKGGNPLPQSATQWSCVLDNVTKLVWEVKTNDAGLRDSNNTYSWYSSNGDLDSSGTQNGGNCPDNDCDTYGYANNVNNISLCGASDWRVPDISELYSIRDFSNNNNSPTSFVDMAYFPNKSTSDYWSATPVPTTSTVLYYARYMGASDWHASTDEAMFVRLVRGGQNLSSSSRFTLNGNETVTDNKTALIWMRNIVTITHWQDALNIAENYSFAGKDDWRLPNLKELFSIVDTSRQTPAINTSVFPATASDRFWTSSKYNIVEFDAGSNDRSDVHDSNWSLRVRLVRSGG